GERDRVLDELKGYEFQGATLSFDHDFLIDLGNRDVQVKFLGRGNTGGDAVAFLPKEKIAIVGDLVVYPLPYCYDGYPSEWVQTLQTLSQLGAATIVPGHGPLMHDDAYVALVRHLLETAVAQMTEALRNGGPAMSRTVDDYKGRIDLSQFKPLFAGKD